MPTIMTNLVQSSINIFSLTMLTSQSLLPPIIANSTPVFSTLATFMCGFCNSFIYFKSTQETCAHVYYFPLISSKYLNALAMYIMYHQTSYLYKLTRPSLSWCDPMLCQKLFLKKVSLLQLFFDRYTESKNDKKKLLLVHDDDGTNSCINTPDATDNRTFGLVNTS